jgi:hypothetical protein
LLKKLSSLIKCPVQETGTEAICSIKRWRTIGLSVGGSDVHRSTRTFNFRHDCRYKWSKGNKIFWELLLPGSYRKRFCGRKEILIRKCVSFCHFKRYTNQDFLQLCIFRFKKNGEDKRMKSTPKLSITNLYKNKMWSPKRDTKKLFKRKGARVPWNDTMSHEGNQWTNKCERVLWNVLWKWKQIR